MFHVKHFRKIPVNSEKLKCFDFRTEIPEAEKFGKVIRGAGCPLF